MDFVFRDIGEVKTFVFNMKYVSKIKTVLKLNLLAIFHFCKDNLLSKLSLKFCSYLHSVKSSGIQERVIMARLLSYTY